jgi:choline-glycine betaine transporter
VLLPPWLLTVAILILNRADYALFIQVIDGVIGWILDTFSWLLNFTALATVLVVVRVYFSPFANVRFGGSSCRPSLSYPSFVWMVLCTITGAGLMLWACAEPMYHLHHPPANVASGPMSGEAIMWAMENIILSWSFTPMAIYALPTILFAFVFYNMGKPFSISSLLSPLLRGKPWGDRFLGGLSPIIDSVCLFCLGMGMAASLGLGVVLVSGGLEKLSAGALPSGPGMWIGCALVIVAGFLLSASVGLMRGMRLISIANSWFFLALGVFMLLIGPTTYILSLCVESLGAYLSDFLKISLWTSTAYGDGWSRKWPTFYWTVWLAWMPVSIAFLGRIARGFTVRQTLNAVFVIPSVFSILWIVIFSGTAVFQELAGLGVYAAMEAGGAAAATYAILGNLPLSALTIPLFIVTAALSYITSADANTNAIAGLCTKGISAADSESPIFLKILWGLTIGALSVIMLVAYDIEAVKLLSYLGGLSVVFLMLLFIVGLLKVMRRPALYDIHQEDYDQEGRLADSPRSR